MRRSKKYKRVWLSTRAVERIVAELQAIVEDPGKTQFETLTISKGDEDWNYDTLAEFLSELCDDARYARISIRNPDVYLVANMWHPSMLPTEIEISSASRDRIIRLGNVVDSCASDCYVPAPPEPEHVPPKPLVFVGHGNSPQWRDLKDHLQDQHGSAVIAYETGARAGHTIRDVIDGMLAKSSFAVLVMTGEDEMEDGTLRARQNVIHEIGLFQGRLGFLQGNCASERWHPGVLKHSRRPTDTVLAGQHQGDLR